MANGRKAFGGCNLERVGCVVARQAQQRGRECGREEQRGALVRRVREDLFDVVNEADLKHLVCFIEHDKLRPGKGQEPLVVEVHYAAGCPDDKLSAVLQCFDLWLGRVAANNEARFDAACVAELFENVVNLQCELTCRAQDEPEDSCTRGVDQADHAGAKCERLARTGFGLSDDVPAFEHGANGQALDGSGDGDSHSGDGALDFVAEIPLCKELDVWDVRGGVQF